MRTHYDNLKVAENAPPEVIRAAYRALAQKYHPDVNPGDAQASQIMLILNDAHDVLGNPRTRAEYDRQLAMQRRASAPLPVQPAYSAPRQPPSPHPVRQPMRTRPRASAPGPVEMPFFRLLRDYPLLPATAVILVIVFFSEASRQYRDSTAAVMALATSTGSSEVPSPVIFKAPAKAPNGEPWPAVSGYLTGVPVLASGGSGSILLENPDAVSDVHVKLISVAAAGGLETVVRECQVKAGTAFELGGVAAGRYEIRYRNFGHRSTAKTDPFDVVERVHVSDEPASLISLKLTLPGGANRGIQALDPSRF